MPGKKDDLNENMPEEKDDLKENLPEKKDDLNKEQQRKMFMSDILVLACEPIRLLVHQSLHPHYHKSNSKKTPPIVKSEFNPALTVNP